MLKDLYGIEYIDNGQTAISSEEAAGSIGKFLGIIAAIAIPFAAPAIFGAIAGSGILGAGLASAVTGGVVTGLGGVLGSAVVGGIMNAGIAYASGARGGDVWRAAGIGALSGGIGGLSHAFAAGASATSGAAGVPGAAAATAGAPAIAATSAAAPGALSSLPVGAGTAGAGLGGSLTAGGGVLATGATAAPTLSSAIVNGITRTFGNIGQTAINRIGAVLTNAAVNGQSMGRLDGLVAQQRAELEALRVSDKAAYDQRISAAQQILSSADRMDPAWYARTRMADVAGMEANQFEQTMRNIAVRQGGAFDSGQQNAYERGAALHAARSKALAYNQGFVEATGTQNNLRAQGAGLLGPDTAGFQNWQADTELRAAQERAHREASNSTWGGVGAALFGEHNYNPSTSPDPSAPQNGNSDETGILGGMFNWGSH